MNRSKLLLISILFLSLGLQAQIKQTKERYDNKIYPSISSELIIKLEQKGQTIDRQFYGSHLDSTSPIPTQQYLEELKIGRLRVGGNEYDTFNWENGLSISYTPEILRPLNKFEIMASELKKRNIDGIFQINLLGFRPVKIDGQWVIKQDFDAQAAYQMIKHLNGTLKLGIEHVSLGNEFEHWQTTHPNLINDEDGMSADEFISRYIDFAMAIRKAQEEVNGDPNSIKIWGPETSGSWLDWNTTNFSSDCQWTDVLAQVACSYGEGQFSHFIPYFFYRLNQAESDQTINPKGYKLLDMFAIHYYPNFRKNVHELESVHTDTQGLQLVSEMLASTQLFHNPNFINRIDLSSFKNFKPNILGRMKQWLSSYKSGAQLVMNEFALDSDPKTVSTYHPIVRPLYLADSIGIMANHNVKFINTFILNSPKGIKVPWALLDSGVQKTHLFYTYKLLTNYFKGQVVAVKDNLGDLINGHATVEGKKINLVLVNKEPIEKSINIYTEDKKTKKKLATYIVPAWSTSVLLLEKNPGRSSRHFEVYTYGAKEMNIPVDQNYSQQVQQNEN